MQLGLAFGLLALAGEPVIIAATAIAVLILFTRRHGDPELGFTPSASPRLRVTIVSLLIAISIALIIAAPQLIAYSGASEVERARGYSAQTGLNASFDPRRLLELVAGPFIRIDAPHLFPTLMIGLIIIPALFRRSRYTIIAALMLFFALGSFNPLMRAAVESISAIRAGRFPEKFALVMCAALVVLAAEYFRESKTPRIWTIVTFAPLLIWMVWTVPIDWFGPYACRNLRGADSRRTRRGKTSIAKLSRPRPPPGASSGNGDRVRPEPVRRRDAPTSRIAAERFAKFRMRLAALATARTAVSLGYPALSITDVVT